MDFKETYGKTFKFYGVYDTLFKIGPYVFEAIEDEEDGYRSHLKCIQHTTDENLVFLGRSFARVKVVDITDGDRFDGFALVDVDTGHQWLEVGTNWVDEWYPCFIFRYETPKQVELDARRKELTPVRWFTNPEIRNLVNQIREAIAEQNYNIAEKLLEILADAVDDAEDRW